MFFAAQPWWLACKLAVIDLKKIWIYIFPLLRPLFPVFFFPAWCVIFLVLLHFSAIIHIFSFLVNVFLNNFFKNNLFYERKFQGQIKFSFLSCPIQFCMRNFFSLAKFLFTFTLWKSPSKKVSCHILKTNRTNYSRKYVFEILQSSI